MLRLLLITSDPALAQAFEVVATQLQAKLTCVSSLENSSALSADVGLWHTNMAYDPQIYQQLAAQYRCVIVVCSRPKPSLRVDIRVPYLIIPFDPDDACILIRGWYQRISRSTSTNMS